MRLQNIFSVVGFADAGRNYKEHALIVALCENYEDGAPPQRKLAIRFITNEDPVDPEGLTLVPAVAINEHSTKYEMLQNGDVVVTLDNPAGSLGIEIGGFDLWYLQKTEHRLETPPFTLKHYPFQVELRGSETEARYVPSKAKYHDFRQDHSVAHPNALLNEFNLSSKLINIDRFDGKLMLGGNDYRNFGVLYIEFRNELGQPVVNPLFEGIETPSRFGHYILLDCTRSCAHIAADIDAQTRKIHPDIKISINPYEAPPMQRINLTLPLNWSYNRPEFINPAFEVEESGYQQQSAASLDGKTRRFQEELMLLNGSQGVSGTHLGSDGLSCEYSQDPPTPFPFPAQYLYPSASEPVDIPWTTTDFATTFKYEVDAVVPTTAYKFDADRPWQVYAKLNVTPEAGDVALSSAKWIIPGVEGEPDVELPAYFVRYITGMLPPEEGGFPDETPQTASVFQCPEGITYIERQLLKDSVAQADGVGTIEMRVTPPPIDGFGLSPFIGIKLTEAKLRLTFTRPVVDETFAFFVGDMSELQEALALTPDIPRGEIAPNVQNFITLTPSGEVGSPDYKIEITSNLGFNWTSGYATVAILFGKTLVEELVDHYANPDLNVELGFNFLGDWHPVPQEQFLAYLRPDGSVLLPLVISDIVHEEEMFDERLVFSIFVEEQNDMGSTIKDIGVMATLDRKFVGSTEQNQALALPFVMGNVLQGRDPAQVFVEVLLRDIATPNAVARASLASAEAVTGKLFGTAFAGLDFEAVYDSSADTLTVTKMGGPHGAIAISSTTATTPYVPLTVPEGAVIQSVNYADWDDAELATTTHPVTKHIVPLPYPIDGDLFLPQLEVNHTVEALPSDYRTELATAGFTYNTTETVTNNVTIAPGTDEAVSADISVQINLAAPFVKKETLMNAGYDVNNPYTYFFRRECVMVKISEPALISAFKVERAKVDTLNAGNTPYSNITYRSDETNWQQHHAVMLGDCRVVTEAEVEYLLIPVPIYRIHSIGQHNCKIILDLPSVGFQGYMSIEMAADVTFVEPVGVTPLTKLLEDTTPNIAALWSQAANVVCYTLYTDPMSTDQSTSRLPFTGANESTSWHASTQPGTNGPVDSVQAVGFNNSGSLGVRLVARGGSDRPVGALIVIALENVTLPPEFETDQGPFKFVQVENAVLIFTKFDVLTLARNVYPFAQNTIAYAPGYDENSILVQQTVALDKSLLPAPIQAANDNIRVETTAKLSYGYASVSFLHSISSPPTTRTIFSSEKIYLPATADLLYAKSKAEIVVPYEAVYAYESEVGPVPTP